MTIAVAYLTSEGVVFGADSATTVSTLIPKANNQAQEAGDLPPAAVPQPGIPAVLQVFNHAQKMFEVGSPGAGRMALLTWGAGTVCRTSHRTIAARLADQVSQTGVAGNGPPISVSAAVDLLKKIVSELEPAETFGYFLGGIDLPSREPACHRIFFEPGKPIVSVPLQIGQAIFEGAPELFIRAFHGADRDLVNILRKSLADRIGDAVPGFQQLFDQSLSLALSSIPHGGFADLPIREAIDFVHMYLHLTIKGMKFRFGPPICGGPIEIAFVSTDRYFRWVRHKSFDTAIFEEEVGKL